MARRQRTPDYKGARTKKMAHSNSIIEAVNQYLFNPIIQDSKVCAQQVQTCRHLGARGAPAPTRINPTQPPRLSRLSRLKPVSPIQRPHTPTHSYAVEKKLIKAAFTLDAAGGALTLLKRLERLPGRPRLRKCWELQTARSRVPPCSSAPDRGGRNFRPLQNPRQPSRHSLPQASIR